MSIKNPTTTWHCPDIAYIWTMDGFVYLTSIVDLFSRKIIAWTLSETLEVSCVIDTINKAKARRNIDQPLIIHSDRGSQYVAAEYKKATENMQRSYSKKAFPWDNACIESFHSIIKREWLNRFKIRDYKQAYCLILNIWKLSTIRNEFIATATICRQTNSNECMKEHTLRLSFWRVKMGINFSF